MCLIIGVALAAEKDKKEEPKPVAKASKKVDKRGLTGLGIAGHGILGGGLGLGGLGLGGLGLGSLGSGLAVGSAGVAGKVLTRFELLHVTLKLRTGGGIELPRPHSHHHHQEFGGTSGASRCCPN